jgi:hypothetical protein
MTSRKLTVTALCAIVVALAFAAAGGARSEKVVRIGLHDEFAVRNTHILCEVEVSHTLIPGQELVGCAFLGPNQTPVPKTYAVALAVNGKVVLAKVQANGMPKVVYRRPAVVGHTDPSLHILSAGDGVLVKGTSITCAVNKQNVGKTPFIVVSCFQIDLKTGKGKPNSYGVGITDGGAFVVRFDRKSKATPVKVVAHGR